MPLTTRPIYVVMGKTGYYEDTQEWPVVAYLEKELAEEHARRATQRTIDINAKKSNEHDVPEEKNEYDPNSPWTIYDDADYFVQEIPLIESSRKSHAFSIMKDEEST